MATSSLIPRVQSAQEVSTLIRAHPLLAICFYSATEPTCAKVAGRVDDLLLNASVSAAPSAGVGAGPGASDATLSDASGTGVGTGASAGSKDAVLVVRRVDVDDSPSVAKEHDVVQTPCFLFFDSTKSKKKPREYRLVGGDMLALRSTMEKLTKKVTRITSVAELDMLKAKHTRIVVHFFAEWSLQSKKLEPVLEGLAQELHNSAAGSAVADLDTVKLAKVDVNECEVLASEFAIAAPPTLILFKNSIKVAQFIVTQQEPSKEDMRRVVDSLQH